MAQREASAGQVTRSRAKGGRQRIPFAHVADVRLFRGPPHGRARLIRFLQLPCLKRGRTPKVFHPPAQGCETRATLGSRCKKEPNPEGVAATGSSAFKTATPSGLGLVFLPAPRVARSAQPWAGG